MPTFTPDFLAGVTGGHWIRRPERPLTGFSQDTRSLAPGQVFVAVRTERRDGHDFLTAAAERGAGAALVARAGAPETLPQLVVADPLAAFQAIARAHRRRFRGPVIGVTGSAGKTSTKNLLATLLGGEPSVLATEGNLNNHLGVPLTLTRLDPEVHAYAVIEAGISVPGDMDPLAAMIEPDLALVTLVAPAHLEGMGTLEAIAAEKAKLPLAAGLAVLPAAVRVFAAFRGLEGRTLTIEPAEVIRPPVLPPDRAYYAVSHRDATTAISLAYGRPPPEMYGLGRVSDGMAQNAVLAICTALRLGIGPETVRARLAQWRPAGLRGELRRDGDRLLYLDCYNANPVSMADALAAFRRLAPEAEPRLLVLGSMEELGPESRHYHLALGRGLALRPQDRCVAIGGQAEAVRQGALDAGAVADQVETVEGIDAVRERIAVFRGAVFIKGSRKYALERALGGGEPAH
jgi:UDP-N-acetylmuramoyl-tripeptide--D-alanyl-D-alanine ligase